MAIDTLLPRLACPECGSALAHGGHADRLTCAACSESFAVRNGIPHLHPPAASEGTNSIVYEGAPEGQPQSPGSPLAGALRAVLARWLRFQQRLLPVTPLNPLYHIRRYKPLIDALPAGKAVLDAGGGSSPYRTVVSRPGDDYVVFDVAEVVIGPEDDRQAVLGDIHRLPFQREQFDLVLLFEVLEHLYDPARAMAHLSRAMKPQGLLVLTVPQYWHVHGWPSDYFRYTIYGLKHLCEQNGLEVVQFLPKGGPLLLLYAVLKLNFFGFLNLPVIRLLLDVPLVSFVWWLDSTLCAHNLQRRHPDTAGWSLIARKVR